MLPELIFQRVATEIEHFLRLSRMAEYVSSSQESKVREYWAREKRAFSLELDIPLKSE